MLVLNGIEAECGRDSWQYRLVLTLAHDFPPFDGNIYKQVFQYIIPLYVAMTFVDVSIEERVMNVIDFVVIAFFLVHYGLTSYLERTAFNQLRRKFVFPGSGFSQLPVQEQHMAIRLGLLGLTLIAWAVRVSGGPNLVLYCRPLMLITGTGGGIKVAWIFIATTMDAYLVFMFLMVVYVVSAILFMLLYHQVFTAVAGDPVLIDSFLQSFVHMFMYVTAGDNYGTLVAPSYAYSETYIFFLYPVAFLGVFFIMALVIGAFEESFSKFSSELDQLKMKQETYTRATVFALWTIPSPEEEQILTEHDFVDLLRAVPQTSVLVEIVLDAMFILMDKDVGGSLDFNEFDSYWKVATIVSDVQGKSMQMSARFCAAYWEQEMATMQASNKPWVRHEEVAVAHYLEKAKEVSSG